MNRKFFVTVVAASRLNLLNLRKYELLDLFQPTAMENDQGEFTIDGLLTLEDIGSLVAEGYKVIVREDSEKKAQALRKEVIEFQQWIKGTKDTLEKEESEDENDDANISPTGYLTAEGIESALQRLATDYPSICKIIPLEKKTHEGRLCRAVRIGSMTNSNNNKLGVLFIAGVHAREVVNPDLLVSLAFKLCHAYKSGTELVFKVKSGGKKTYDASAVQQIVNSLDIFIFPLVNPDGRVFVLSPIGDAWWRRNKNPNPGLDCKGVDINRNYDFLWESGIGSSQSSCSQTFKGKNALSEPETRNVIDLLKKFANIKCMIDIHSYSQLILYPWGDDNNQSVDPMMNFREQIYDGQRGNLGDSEYREYIPQQDLIWFEEAGAKLRDAIKALRGIEYTLQQGVGLYPTSATSNDFFYSRHFVDVHEKKVMAYTLETGTAFHPRIAEGENIISEVSAGLVEFCLTIIFSPPPPSIIEKETRRTTASVESHIDKKERKVRKKITK